MKRLRGGAVILLVALAGAASAKAQDVSQADKDRALQYLESTKKGVLDATRGLSEAQWNFKAAPDKWPVAECARAHCGGGRFHSRHSRRRPRRTATSPRSMQVFWPWCLTAPI